jgi:hypothetical protein
MGILDGFAKDQLDGSSVVQNKRPIGRGCILRLRLSFLRDWDWLLGKTGQRDQ